MPPKKEKKLFDGFLPFYTINQLVCDMNDANLTTESCDAIVPHQGLLRHFGISRERNELPEFVLLVDKAEDGSKDAPFLQHKQLCTTLRAVGVMAISLKLESYDFVVARIRHELPFVAEKRKKKSSIDSDLDMLDDGNDNGDSADDADDSDANSLDDLSDHERSVCLSKRKKALRDQDVYPLLEHLAGIERKTGFDMASSIMGTKKGAGEDDGKVKTNRRMEQREKMLMGPPGPAVWLYIDNGYEGLMLKQNTSALIHDTFSLDGMKNDIKLCTFRLRTDGEVPEFLKEAFRRTVESYLEQNSGAVQRQSMALLSHKMRQKRSDPTAAFCAGLMQMVVRLGYGHAQAIVRAYKTYFEWSKRLVEAAQSQRTLDAFQQELANLRSTTGDQRHIGKKLARSIIRVMIGNEVSSQEAARDAVKRGFDDDDDDSDESETELQRKRRVRATQSNRKRRVIESDSDSSADDETSAPSAWDESDDDDDDDDVLDV